VSNAFKFTDSGAIRIEGTVTIDNKRLDVQVTGSEKWFSRRYPSKLFGRFVTAKRIVDAHSDHNNKQAGRATFTIVLPPQLDDGKS